MTNELMIDGSMISMKMGRQKEGSSFNNHRINRSSFFNLELPR